MDARAIIGYNREIYVIFTRIMELGIQRGEVKSDLIPDELSQHFVMAMRGLCYEWCIRYPGFDLKEQTVEHVRLLIDGIVKSTIK